MDLKRFFADDRAVSPVIGVILMVAITVILAAVIGSFVLGLTDNVSSTPQAQFQFEYSGGAGGDVTITHQGGDAIPENDLVLAGGNSTVQDPNFGSDDEVTAGDSINYGVTTGDTVRVIYENPDSDQSSVLAEFDADG